VATKATILVAQKYGFFPKKATIKF